MSIQQQKHKVLKSNIRKNESQKIVSSERTLEIENNSEKVNKQLKMNVHCQLNSQRKKYDQVATLQKQKQADIALTQQQM